MHVGFPTINQLCLLFCSETENARPGSRDQRRDGQSETLQIAFHRSVRVHKHKASARNARLCGATAASATYRCRLRRRCRCRCCRLVVHAHVLATAAARCPLSVSSTDLYNGYSAQTRPLRGIKLLPRRRLPRRRLQSGAWRWRQWYPRPPQSAPLSSSMTALSGLPISDLAVSAPRRVYWPVCFVLRPDLINGAVTHLSSAGYCYLVAWGNVAKQACRMSMQLMSKRFLWIITVVMRPTNSWPISRCQCTTHRQTNVYLRLFIRCLLYRTVLTDYLTDVC